MKFKEVPVSNLDTLKAADVVKKVQAALGNPKADRGGKSVDKFNQAIHVRCWRRYKVRPASGSSTPQETNRKFCVFDKRHNDYGYTQAWADFLVEKLKDTTEFDAVCKSGQSLVTAAAPT